MSRWRSALALLILAVPAPGSAQGLDGDPFATRLVGDWQGRGIYQGNELSVTRTWSLELGGVFLRVDMAVSMPNGASFGALTYWRASGDAEYDVVWLDGIGRMQMLHAVRDRTGSVSTEFVDPYTEGGPQERRWVFEATGPDGYVERLFARTGDGWELLTEWTFRRAGEP